VVAGAWGSDTGKLHTHGNSNQRQRLYWCDWPKRYFVAREADGDLKVCEAIDLKPGQPQQPGIPLLRERRTSRVSKWAEVKPPPRPYILLDAASVVHRQFRGPCQKCPR